jgi:peptidyl-prolyl cis-trans isomerase C
MKKWLKEPLLHFLVIGVGIYGLYGILGSSLDDEDERTIIVSTGEIKAISDQWTRQRLRPPTEEELAGVIRDHVRTQVLYREAVAMGLDNGDRVIERRLAQRLKLLVQRITPEEPSEDELRAWFEENEKKFKLPDLYSLFQVYFNPDKHGAATLDDAKAALSKLESFEEVPADFVSYGDRLLSQSYYSSQTEVQLSKTFGSGFVDQVIKLEPGAWHGPVFSGYGTHLVYVNEVTRPPAPDFSAFAEQAKEAWMAEKVKELSERFIENLIAGYEITIEDIDVPLTVPGPGALL